MKKAFLWSIALFFLAQNSEAAKTVFNFGNGSEPKDLDPHTVTGEPEHNITLQLFEGLVTKDPKTLKLQPGIAEKWTVSKDGKVHTYFLRKNARFSNGDPITAKDVVYSIIRLVTPETAAEYAYHGHYIKGAKDFTAGKIKDPSQVGIKAKDDYTVEITLEEATPFFPLIAAYQTMFVVHRPTIEKHGMRWTRPENMVTSGPFMLKNWEVNKVVTLKKNPHYWDSGKVKLEEVNFYGPEKQATEESMFRTGKLDTTLYLQYERWGHWKKLNDGSLRSYPVYSVYSYRMNVQKPPLNDKRIRRALTIGFDRSRIVKFVTGANEKPSRAYTPPGIGGYEPTPRLPADGSGIAEAKKLLAEAGYPGGKGFPKIELIYNTDERHKKLAEAIQVMWKQNLGIDVGLANQEWKVVLDSMRTRNYFLGRFSWSADYDDPNTFLELWQTDNGNNETGWSNKSYDELIVAAGKELNQKKRLELFKKAEDILMDELPVIPVFVYTKNHLMSPKVRGWYDNAESYHPLKEVYFVD